MRAFALALLVGCGGSTSQGTPPPTHVAPQSTPAPPCEPNDATASLVALSHRAEPSCDRDAIADAILETYEDVVLEERQTLVQEVGTAIERGGITLAQLAPLVTHMLEDENRLLGVTRADAHGGSCTWPTVGELAAILVPIPGYAGLTCDAPRYARRADVQRALAALLREQGDSRPIEIDEPPPAREVATPDDASRLRTMEVDERGLAMPPGARIANDEVVTAERVLASLQQIYDAYPAGGLRLDLDRDGDGRGVAIEVVLAGMEGPASTTVPIVQYRVAVSGPNGMTTSSDGMAPGIAGAIGTQPAQLRRALRAILLAPPDQRGELSVVMLWVRP